MQPLVMVLGSGRRARWVLAVLGALCWDPVPIPSMGGGQAQDLGTKPTSVFVSPPKIKPFGLCGSSCHLPACVGGQNQSWGGLEWGCCHPDSIAGLSGRTNIVPSLFC